MIFAFFISKGKDHSHTHTQTYLVQHEIHFFLLLALSPVSLSCLIAPHLPTIHIRDLEATLACPLTLLGGPASCTSSWPSPLPGLPLSLGPQRQPAQSTHHSQGLANLWYAESQGLRQHPAPLGWLLARWSASASGCGSGWSLESRGTQKNAFQALVSVTSQRPSFQKFGVGT